MILEQAPTIHTALSYFKYLKDKGSFGLEEYSKIDRIVSEIGAGIRNGSLSKEEVQKISFSFGKELLNDTLQGMALLKPFGYAGDFLMIDKIYTYHLSENKWHRSWDEYFQAHSAPKAVRNRKEYFKGLIRLRLKEQPSMDLLNVASGPARDLKEMYAEIEAHENIHSTCIEMDKKAVDYAKGINLKNLNKIKFVNANIFRHRDDKKYDIVWSAGLFDYFNDKAFIMMLKRFKEWVREDGEIIIGNFNQDHNPSRDYMEIFGEWFLNHRTEGQLMQLALHGGFEEKQITIGKEKENVNLFLHLKMN